MLVACKTWGGPFTNVGELNLALQTSENPKHMVCTELSYMRQVHPMDIISQPALYRLNKITCGEQLENLLILLGDTSSTAPLPLPTNDDIIDLISDIVVTPPTEELHVNDLVAVVWEEGVEQMIWYLGHISSILDDGEHVMVEHLKGSRDCLSWKRHDTQDFKTTIEQILDIAPVGEWDLTVRNPIYKLNRDCKTAIIQATAR